MYIAVELKMSFMGIYREGAAWLVAPFRNFPTVDLNGMILPPLKKGYNCVPSHIIVKVNFTAPSVHNTYIKLPQGTVSKTRGKKYLLTAPPPP